MLQESWRAPVKASAVGGCGGAVIEGERRWLKVITPAPLFLSFHFAYFGVSSWSCPGASLGVLQLAAVEEDAEFGVDRRARRLPGAFILALHMYSVSLTSVARSRALPSPSHHRCERFADRTVLLSPRAGLRVTHTAAESIHESIREEDRRRIKRLASRRGKKGDFDPSQGSNLKPKRSIFTRRKRAPSSPPEPNSGVGGPTYLSAEDEKELGPEERAQLERQRTRANAAAEAEESARRQERQDEKKGKGKKGEALKTRRAVYVNLDGPLTDPRGYERNKVRTSKYTLISFIPKVGVYPFTRWLESR